MSLFNLDVKRIHESIRSRLDDILAESHEVRGESKGYEVRQKYTRNGDIEIEEIYLHKGDYTVSLYIASNGVYTATINKDGKIEAKDLSREELEKIIKDIISMISS